MIETRPLSPEQIEAVADNVDLIEREFLTPQGIGAEDWREGVAYLSEFIEREREAQPDKDPGGLVPAIGSYLGEAVIHLHGGEWVQTEHGVGVSIAGTVAFPFAKTAKQFAHGRDDDILSFLTVLPAILAQEPSR